MNTNVRSKIPPVRGKKHQRFDSILGIPGNIVACMMWLAVIAAPAALGAGAGGGGGHTETAGNNLSVPAIWADTAGPGMTLPGVEGELPGVLQAKVTVPWSTMVGGYYAYAQKVEGNVWQAENEVAAGVVYVNEIDWGDMLESAPLKTGVPIRIELALYETDVSKAGFEMVMLANPSSPNEVQGTLSPLQASATNPVSAANLIGTIGEATVYSPFGKLVVQKLVGTREDVLPGDLFWTGTQWLDANVADPSDVGDPDTSLTFAGEINVGGKVIYGLSKGGWRVTQAGDYRITFYLPLNSEARFDVNTVIRESLETEAVIALEEGGATAVVDYTNNLSYIDVRVASGGGSSNKGGKKK